jgi:hypothetical protein
MAGRFIKLYDKILQWEWYSDINTFRLFIHLLLKANYKDMKFEGKTIQRGQLITSLPSLSAQTGLSVRQVRVSLDKLKLTGEVTSTTYPKYRIITIVKYDSYQSVGRQNDRQMTGNTAGEWQADDRQMTASIDNIEQIDMSRNIEQVERESTPHFTPPTIQEIRTFCQENGLFIDVDRFIDYYQSNGWKVGRNKMKDWKATVRNWARDDQKKKDIVKPSKQVIAQQYEQRDYSKVDDYYSSEQDREMEEFMRRENNGS